MSPPAAGVHELADRLREVAEVLDRAVGDAGPGPDWCGAAAAAYAVASAALRRRVAGVAAVLEELAGRLVADASTVPVVAAALVQDLLHARLLLAVERDLAAPGEPARADHAAALRDALARIEATVDPVTGRPVEGHLLAYEPTAFGGDGAVTVAVGDPATADDVAVVVPGLGADASSAPREVARALRLHEAARFLDPHDGNATVAWIGYDAPDGPVEALTERRAVAGGERLAEDLDDLLTARPAGPAHLTVLGHSYGSTTAALGAYGPGLAADDLVLVGSPGAGGPVDRAADTGLDPDRVWVARNSHDPVAALGAAGPLGLGDDPATEEWGGRRIRAESTEPADARDAHTAYFDHDGESLHHLALVVAGRHGEVEGAEPVRGSGLWAHDPELDRDPASPPTRPVR
ncbi:alpha/beta hydrolase [Nocardioides euryhalodurans]|uniref:DUF1023 domain-containing protein n=1 Tax=Nocardioides euryhalodurans TaxID=2518370 RepID=A0A4P7GP95_9ACTN|nr:alpha/beta hydrolase [Nocardioides euryhalodurans]QBR93940.1 hypothetical protein EXE57_17860 [Nocardioides euryhalodurans]